MSEAPELSKPPALSKFIFKKSCQEKSVTRVSRFQKCPLAIHNYCSRAVGGVIAPGAEILHDD